MIDGEDEGAVLETEIEEQPEEGAEQQQAAPEQDDGELHIEIEGEEEPEDPVENTPFGKKMRALVRDAQIENARLRKAIEPTTIVVPPEPDLWDDCEGDPDKYKAALREHDKLVQAAAEQKQAATQQTQVSQEAFQRARAVYQARAQTLGVKDYKASEDAVVAALPIVTQSAIVQYIKDPEKLVYALGRNPAALAKVEAETDPVLQILMLHDMAKGLKVNRKAPPPPEAETIQRSSTSVAAKTSDQVADKLLSKGDMEGYRAHMSAKRKAAKQA